MLTIEVPNWRGPCTRRCVGAKPYRIIDQREITLVEWESLCTVFSVSIPSTVNASLSKSLQTVTCSEHRMSPAHASKLSRIAAKRKLLPLALAVMLFPLPLHAAETLPDLALTPGSTRTASKADICTNPHTAQYRHWSRERDDHILEEYGLPAGPHATYEIDHLIPLDLGGADSDDNLWPEPRSNIVEWRLSAEAKDKLEWRMHALVCSGQVDLVEAQHEIATDWRALYVKYFH